MYDGRPSGELVLATGDLEADNPADHLTMQVRALVFTRSCKTCKIRMYPCLN